MMPRTLLLQAATALLALAAHEASAFNVNVINRCEKTIDLAQVDPSGVKMQSLAPGATTTRTFPPGSGSHVLKAGAGAQATCTCVLTIFTTAANAAIMSTSRSTLKTDPRMLCVLLLCAVAEFSGEGGKAWYDISIIPTGPKSGVRLLASACEARVL